MNNQNLFNEIREKIDIVDLIGENVPLVQKGRNYFGVCPFHNDNNPSLVVHPKKNIATCFSCGVTGNVISFVQKYEKQVNGNDLSINQAIAKVVEICNLNIDISKLKDKIYLHDIIGGIGYIVGIFGLWALIRASKMTRASQSKER